MLYRHTRVGPQYTAKSETFLVQRQLRVLDFGPFRPALVQTDVKMRDSSLDFGGVVKPERLCCRPSRASSLRPRGWACARSSTP
eukprot:378663-Rhodomonas_salina.2